MRKTFFFVMLGAASGLSWHSACAQADSTKKYAVNLTADDSLRLPSQSLIDSLQGLVRLDSARKQNASKKLFPKTWGTVSAGYDYGVIPLAANAVYPMGYYSSEGSAGVSVLGLPLNLTYYYTSLRNATGLNNYFRISFDAPRYQESLRQESVKKLEEERNKLAHLKELQQAVEQRRVYQELLLKQHVSPELLNDKLARYKSSYATFELPAAPDSLRIPGMSENPYADSIKMMAASLRQYDSIAAEANKYKRELDDIRKQVSATEKRIGVLQQPHNLIYANTYNKKSQAFVSGIKRLDIGLCHPGHTAFLVNGSTLKGVNFEWEKKFYFAFTYGKTINTLLATNNVIQNQMQARRNLYNFFDFNDATDSRKIMAIKGGIGKKAGSHLYVGALYGAGLPSYFSASLSSYVEKNVVLELDGRVLINAANSIDVVLGKSVLYQNEIPEDPRRQPSQLLFSGFRSNAALVRYNSQIDRTRTRLILTGRLIDPFFSSYGVGFMRSDNLRYEARAEQAIGKRVKFSAFYRKDRDNLLRASFYTTNLHAAGANVSLKVNRRLRLMGSYMPVVQDIRAADTSRLAGRRVNNISNATISYMPRTGKVSSFFTGLYSHYQFDGADGSKFYYQNISLSNTTAFSAALQAGASANYFFNDFADSLNTFLASANIALLSKKGSALTLGVKYANNSLLPNQAGCLLKVSAPLTRFLRIEIQAERLVLGDFYSSYNLAGIRKFPYYGYGKIIFSW